MIDVKIQISAEALRKFPLLADAAARLGLARDIMEGARAQLVQKASQTLHSTRADFLAGVQPLLLEGNAVVLAIVGKLPNMVENGWDGRLLHDTLLSDEASGWKISADGFRYRSIPFRHKSPGSGPQGGQPMGSQYSGAPKAMSNAAPHAVVEDVIALGKKVHGAAKKLKPGKALQKGLAPKLREHHTVDIFAGMKANLQPVQKADGSVGHQRTYTTFRTISEANRESWYHPGIQARNFLDSMGDYIQKIAPAAIEAFVGQVLK